MPANPRHDDTTTGPSAPWLAAGFLLAGLGTVLLGPILPSIISNWRLADSQAGVLLLAKFVGAFIGGVSVPRRLRFGIFTGMVLSCLGFGAFGLCHNLLTGSLSLFVGGIGLGQIIASTNILAGRRYRCHTGSALASLNFFWSLGAVGAGLLVAAMMPRFGLRNLLLGFGASFLVAGIGGSFGWIVGKQKHPVAERLEDPENPAASLTDPAIAIVPHRLARQTFLLFALMLFLYGGLETCFTGWLTTYTLRYSDARLLGGQSAIVLLWAALTAGRALSSAALRFIRESTALRLGLAFSLVFIAALTTTHRALPLSLCCILLGLSLSPFFPATFALLMRRNPTAREAGFILAVSGLGAAAFPWLMGVVSTHSGSLRTAMAIPMLLTLLLLAVSFLGVASANEQHGFSPSS